MKNKIRDKCVILALVMLLVLTGCDRTGGRPSSGSDPSPGPTETRPEVRYEISFDANGGTMNSTTATTGTDGVLNSLPVPSREGHTFDGWYTDGIGGEKITAGDAFASDATLYAHWTENVYTITFDANGGSESRTVATTAAGRKLASLPPLTRAGYVFDGWYTMSAGGSQVTTDTVFAGNAVVYAHWSKDGASRDDSGMAGKDVFWSYTDATKTLKIWGTGKMSDFGTGAAPWKACADELTTVVIEDGVAAIGKNAFYRCGSLTSVTIPDSVAEIGAMAFAQCRSLASVTVPDSVKKFGTSVFADCTALTSATLQDGVTGTCAGMFSGCSSLTSVSLPNTIAVIGESMFYDCSSLTGITIPDSVTRIGAHAFDGCGSLADVTLPANVVAIDGWGFHECSKLSLTIPDDSLLTSIGEYAFQSSGLACVKIPANVTSIAWHAFEDCRSLSDVTFSASSRLTGIGESAFSNCVGLSSITVPDGVTSVGRNAFSHCSSLKDATIPGSVASAGENAFFGCDQLRYVTIGEGVTGIGRNMFGNCGGLKSITIPSTVTSIGSGAFKGSGGLKDVYYGGTGAQWSTVKISADNGPLLSATIHNGSAVSDHWAGNTYDITFSANGGSVSPSSAVTGTDCKLTSLPVPTRAGYSFDGWFPSPVYGDRISTDTVFDKDATIYARWTENTYSITFNANGGSVSPATAAVGASGRLTDMPVPVRSGYDFAGWYTSLSGGTYVPPSHVFTGPVTLYAHWTDKSAYGTVTWRLNGTTLYVEGSGQMRAMTDYTGSQWPWNGSKADITAVVIGNGITDIGSSAFSGCANLTSVSIPSTVTSIGPNAFSYCTSLASVDIQSGETAIGPGMSVYRSDLSSIGSSAFAGCSSLSSISIPSGVAVIGLRAFNDCVSLTGITIPRSVNSIGDSAFSGCRRLSSVTILGDISNKGRGVFSGCDSLTNVPAGFD